MEQHRLIAIAGDQWSGKSTITKYAATRFAEARARIWMGSAHLQEIVRRRGWEDARPSYDKLVCELKERHGPGFMTAVMIEHFGSLPGGPILYDGIRIPEEVTLLRENPRFRVKVLYITADQELRFHRGLGQPKNGRTAYKSWDEFIESENLPMEMSVKAIHTVADRVLRTDGWDLHTYEEITEIFSTWLAT